MIVCSITGMAHLKGCTWVVRRKTFVFSNCLRREDVNVTFGTNLIYRVLTGAEAFP